MDCLQSITMKDLNSAIPAAARSLTSSVFPLHLHPCHAALQEDMCEWAKVHLGHLLSEADIMKIRKADYGWLACSFWPFSRLPHRSLTLLKLMFWFIVFDDAIDNSIAMSRDAGAAHAYCSLLLDTLFGVASESTSTASKSSADALQELIPKDATTKYSERELLPLMVGLEWWGEMKRDGMPLAQQVRFATAVRDYVMAQVNIVRFNKLLDAGRPPALCDFLAIRRVAVGAPLCFLASEYDLGVELDEETLNHPLLQALHAAVSDHVAWLNDILSFPKEFARGDFLNLLSMLHIESNTTNANADGCDHEVVRPFHVTAMQAWDMTTARQRDCAHLAFKIMDAPHLSSKPSMQAYVDAVCSITTGNWAWSLKCSRYNADPSTTKFTVPSIQVHPTPTTKIIVPSIHVLPTPSTKGVSTVASLCDATSACYKTLQYCSHRCVGGCKIGKPSKRSVNPSMNAPRLMSFPRPAPTYLSCTPSSFTKAQYSCGSHISPIYKIVTMQ